MKASRHKGNEMTLQQIIKKHEGKEMPQEIRRKAWLIKDPDFQNCFCYCSSGNFYTEPNCGGPPFPFDMEDLTANDWEYSETIWVTK